MTPEQYQMLADAKLTVEQIGVVMKIMAQAEADMKAAEEARKAVARERVQRWRDKQKYGVTLQKRNGDATERLTRAEDSSSRLEISGSEKGRETPAASHRKKATRLTEDWVAPQEWIDEAVKEGMTPAQAVASSVTMRNWSLSDKNGAKLDWLATWRNWFARELKQQRGRAPPKRSYVDAAMDRIAGQANGTESVFGPHSNVELLSPRGREPGSDDAHLRGGISRRIVSGSG